MSAKHLMRIIESELAARPQRRAWGRVSTVLARVRAVAAIALGLSLAACSSSGGPPTVVNQPTGTGATTNSYNGPVPQNADIQAFEVNFWNNVRTQDRCGGCHYAGGQSPMFARSDDVNAAYTAALPYVNVTNPSQSIFVTKVAGGHNCWLADPNACASTIQQWIVNWLGGGAAATSSITLVPPPSQTVVVGKQFPTSATDFQATVYQLVAAPHNFCSPCHTPESPTAQAPYFANDLDVNAAYSAAQPLMNLNNPAASRLVERLAAELHHCWPTATSGGAPDCPGSAAEMQTQITNFANMVTAGTPDPNMAFVSKTLSLTQGTIAAGGSRYDGAVIAKYMFQTGQGNIAYDTSGVTPESDLNFSNASNCSWVLGWGVSFATGCKLQATTAASSKLAQLIQPTNEYSFEVWAAPANVAQTNAWIMSYSGSDTTRNATLGQNAQQYLGRTRSSATDTDGSPPLLTSMTGMFAQAALQHVVLTYDPVNGQKLYVNGTYTGDVDPSKGGTFANWDNTFALVLGSEVSGKEQWQGVIKFAAVHNAALTAAQIQQNFAAGVGQRFYLMFDVSALTGIASSYVVILASQFDNYSYLLTTPTFLVLNGTTAPAPFTIAGIRIGMNGALITQGQAWSTLNVSVGGSAYNTTTGQVLSKVGTVVASDLGAASDMLFLSFDQIGTNTHTYQDPTAPSSAPVPSSTAAAPDVGVKTYAQLNYAMSAITGVPMTDSVVATLFNSEQQAMPSIPQIGAFQISQQMAVSQLATAYCHELVNTASYRDAFFGTGLDSSLTAPAGTFFASPTSQNIVITPLVSNVVGTGVNTTAATAIQNELVALLATRIPSLNSSTTVATATQAACTAVLGSGALLFQ
jgi:hypothetical protein